MVINNEIFLKQFNLNKCFEVNTQELNNCIEDIKFLKEQIYLLNKYIKDTNNKYLLLKSNTNV